MGCSESKCYNQKNNPQQRVHDYQKESRRFMRDIKIQPNTLLPEHFGGGYISAYQFYNYFHAGFCAPYICNPNYMLIVDFRTIEEYRESHLWTAIHHSFIRWDMSTLQDLQKYSYVIFYDHDGTAAANIYSHISATFAKLTAAGIDISCILGGINRVELHFPHLISYEESINNKNLLSNGNSKSHPNGLIRNGTGNGTAGNGMTGNGIAGNGITGNGITGNGITGNGMTGNGIIPAKNHKLESISVPWMPCSVMASSLFLGSLEQARNPKVIKSLGITHIVSIGRSPEWKSKSVSYMALDGERNLYVTFLKACEFIQSALEKGGKVLVHGIEGLNRSAAVLMAFLMSNTTCILEDVFIYMKYLRPHLSLDQETLVCLLRWEASIFGTQMTDLEELWT